MVRLEDLDLAIQLPRVPNLFHLTQDGFFKMGHLA